MAGIVRKLLSAAWRPDSVWLAWTPAVDELQSIGEESGISERCRSEERGEGTGQLDAKTLGAG